MERKCTDPNVVKSSGGKAACPDNLFRAFAISGDCSRCPKVGMNKQRILASSITSQEKQDRVAGQITFSSVIFGLSRQRK